MKRVMDDIQKLEEVKVSCKSGKRKMLLRQLLDLLEHIESNNICHTSEDYDEPQFVPRYDVDQLQDTNLNFRDIFLRSHAVEGIIISMILEAPNYEECTLILEILRRSIMGKREDHNAIMSIIQELTNVFSSYHDEVLTTRDELLQYVQVAIRGIKVNANEERIDMEVSILQTQMYDDDGSLSEQKNVMTMEVLKAALSKIRMYLKLKELLQQKKAIRDGDCSETHAQKVNKMNILLESLTKSISKAEFCIEDNRFHKIEAIRFRSAKATEVSKVEKELVAEIETLEKQKGELEKALQQVNDSITVAKTSLDDVKDERDHFHEANNVILYQLQLKETELSKSITSSKSESMVISTLIKFVEDAWNVQHPYIKQLEKHTIHEVETHSKYYAEMIIQLLQKYKVGLGNLVSRFRIIIRQLKASEEFYNTYNMDDESFPIAVTRTSLEEEYLQLEAKLVNAFDLVECMKETSTQGERFPRKEEENVKELFDTLGTMKVEFQSLKRPSLQCRAQKQLIWQGTPLKLKPKEDTKNNDFAQKEHIKNTTLDWNLLGLEDATPETTSAKLSKSYFVQDITDWEFDALGN